MEGEANPIHDVYLGLDDLDVFDESLHHHSSAFHPPILSETVPDFNNYRAEGIPIELVDFPNVEIPECITVPRVKKAVRRESDEYARQCGLTFEEQFAVRTPENTVSQWTRREMEAEARLMSLAAVPDSGEYDDEGHVVHESPLSNGSSGCSDAEKRPLVESLPVVPLDRSEKQEENREERSPKKRKENEEDKGKEKSLRSVPSTITQVPSGRNQILLGPPMEESEGGEPLYSKADDLFSALNTLSSPVGAPSPPKRAEAMKETAQMVAAPRPEAPLGAYPDMPKAAVERLVREFDRWVDAGVDKRLVQLYDQKLESEVAPSASDAPPKPKKKRGRKSKKELAEIARQEALRKEREAMLEAQNREARGTPAVQRMQHYTSLPSTNVAKEAYLGPFVPDDSTTVRSHLEEYLPSLIDELDLSLADYERVLSDLAAYYAPFNLSAEVAWIREMLGKAANKEEDDNVDEKEENDVNKDKEDSTGELRGEQEEVVPMEEAQDEAAELLGISPLPLSPPPQTNGVENGTHKTVESPVVAAPAVKKPKLSNSVLDVCFEDTGLPGPFAGFDRSFDSSRGERTVHMDCNEPDAWHDFVLPAAPDAMGFRKVTDATEGEIAAPVSLSSDVLREIQALQTVVHAALQPLQEVVLGQALGEIRLVFTREVRLSAVVAARVSFSLEGVRSLAHQLLAGLAQLQWARLNHGNLCLENVMCGADGVVKLADWFRTDAMAESVAAVRVAAAPEQVFLESGLQNSKSDVWSFGVVVASVLLQQPIFVGPTRDDQIYNTIRIVGPLSPQCEGAAWDAIRQRFATAARDAVTLRSTFNGLPEPWLKLLQRCFAYLPASRPTASRLLSGPLMDPLPPASALPNFAELPLGSDAIPEGYPVKPYHDYVNC